MTTPFDKQAFVQRLSALADELSALRNWLDAADLAAPPAILLVEPGATDAAPVEYYVPPPRTDADEFNMRMDLIKAERLAWYAAGPDRRSARQPAAQPPARQSTPPPVRPPAAFKPTHFITQHGRHYFVRKHRPGFGIDQQGQEHPLRLECGDTGRRVRKMTDADWELFRAQTGVQRDTAPQDALGRLQRYREGR